MLKIKYKCYRCDREWTEYYECACDSECPKCFAKDVEADQWDEV